ncbi:MAG TPA: alpha/beta fold hydrolase, partial [Actinomycetota bacterium]|nr:alpha/beta fold hydrolase [Actinomycetota bacterium]
MRPEPRTARISSGEMAFLDAGEGPAVVLLHGFPTSSHLWREFLPLLASRFRTIAPDLIGYGASTKAPGTDLSIRAQAGYVRELLAGLGIEGGIAAVGHDIGGGVAQLLAFEGVAACLVLIDAVTLDSWPIE